CTRDFTREIPCEGLLKRREELLLVEGLTREIPCDFTSDEGGEIILSRDFTRDIPSDGFALDRIEGSQGTIEQGPEGFPWIEKAGNALLGFGGQPEIGFTPTLRSALGALLLHRGLRLAHRLPRWLVRSLGRSRVRSRVRDRVCSRDPYL